MLVSKWGNSLAVRLPKKLVEALKLAVTPALELLIFARSVVSVSVEEFTEIDCPLIVKVPLATLPN